MTAMGDGALLLIAHGSARYPDAGRAVLGHAAAIRDAGHFAAVAVGFLSGAPTVAEALAALPPGPVHVVPFFMEDGYFTRVAVPKALEGHDNLRVSPPIGTHPGLTGLIAARIERRQRPSWSGLTRPTQALKAPAEIVLVGHGSARSPGRRLALHDHAKRLGARVALLEEPPLIAEVLAVVPGPTVAVLGFFAGEGGHVRDDLPAAIETARQRLGDGLIDLGSIGDDPGMVPLILDRVRRTEGPAAK
jgi:sirohydrochlorin cobaltochelatase